MQPQPFQGKKTSTASSTLDPGPVSTESQPNNWHFVCVFLQSSLYINNQPTKMEKKRQQICSFDVIFWHELQSSPKNI